MKFKLIKNTKHQNNDIHFSKNGQLRFKSQFVLDFDIKKGDLIAIGIDEDEKEPKSIYLVKSEKEAFKVQDGSGQFFIQAKGAMDNLNFHGGTKFTYERFEIDNYRGMKLTIKP